MASQVGFIFE